MTPPPSLRAVAQGREKGPHGVLADVCIIIGELEKLEGTADGEHDGGCDKSILG